MSGTQKSAERLDKLAERGFVVTLSCEPAHSPPWLLVMRGPSVGQFSRRFFSAAAAISTAWVMGRDAPIEEAPPAPTCPTGKVPIATEAEAEEAATTLTRKNIRLHRPEDQTAARAYRCHECDLWHLTSKPFTRPTPSPR